MAKAEDEVDEKAAVREKGDKRTMILDAAIRVLATSGFQDTKIRDIAQAAGVADGTIYLYFKNKDDLLIQLFEDVMARALAIFREAFADKHTPEEKMRSFLYTHLQLVEKEPQIAQIISVVVRESPKFIQEYKNPLFSDYLHIIQSILTEGIALGVWRSDLPTPLLSRAVFGAVDEIALAWLLSKRRELSLEESARAISEWVLGGLRQA